MMKRDIRIKLFNQETQKIVYENVFKEIYLRLLYNTIWGQILTGLFVKRRLISKIYGFFQKRAKSKKKIKSFIEKYSINIKEINKTLSEFKSFNDFFIRKLKPEARPIENDNDVLISPADSRLQVYKINNNMVIPIKGRKYTLQQLLPEYDLLTFYYEGFVLIFRLSPCDYHRFCYIDNGYQSSINKIRGNLHSVNPFALTQNIPVFTENYREYCILRTKNFGDIIQIDVGALVVGRIIQHKEKGGHMTKGEEKGYFEFGGSTIILLVKPLCIRINKKIMLYSNKGIETIVKYGSGIGKKNNV